MKNQVTPQQIWNSINFYEQYYNGKLTPRKKYIMNCAIERFIKYNELENPNEYLLYIISDKALNHIKSKSEQGMITELADELQKDLHIFQALNK